MGEHNNLSHTNMRKEKLEKRIIMEIVKTIPLYIFSILVPILAWYGFLQYDDKSEIWFQRSGSLMVLFAIWAEFTLFTIMNIAIPVSEKGKTVEDTIIEGDLQLKFNKTISALKFLAAILALFGTLIWGYGDIFWLVLNNS